MYACWVLVAIAIVVISPISYQNQLQSMAIDFVDESDPVGEMITEIEAKCLQGHWKSATRKLKQTTRRFPYEVAEETFVKVLTACSENRLQGARASEPARKIMEQLVEKGFSIPEQLGNHCIENTIGFDGSFSTHQGFGGIDTALAMVAAMEQANSFVYGETYQKLAVALAKEGSLDECLSILQMLVVNRAETPDLSTFASIADHATKHAEDEHMVTLLSYVKAAGHDLDTIAETDDGLRIINNAVVSAERLEKDPLVFRLLGKEGTRIAASSPAAQRACTLVHKRAIVKATEEGEWKLAVKVLELMIQRSLRPSPWIWRNVVACCAKAQKSKRATSLLFDWIKLSKDGRADTPPLSVFNTCINACEICNEKDLTVLVLEAMKETHDTEGNLITFNIALKRLAKKGNYLACEGIIIGMLQSGVEPSVVSYTTAIAACASSEPKNPDVAYEWIKRMRSRQVSPNVITYNTALAACADGTLNGSRMGSLVAKELFDDVDEQLRKDDESTEKDSFTNVLPDAATKEVARKLMQQLKRNWSDGLIAKKEATETIRVPLLALVDFQKSEAAEVARQRKSQQEPEQKEENTAIQVELELESLSHRIAEV